jgi:hypothetical protein
MQQRVRNAPCSFSARALQRITFECAPSFLPRMFRLLLLLYLSIHHSDEFYLLA